VIEKFQDGEVSSGMSSYQVSLKSASQFLLISLGITEMGEGENMDRQTNA
jgi:hypothetical protein